MCPTVRFYVEKRKDHKGDLITKKVPILFSFTWDRKRIKQNAGHRIDAKNWNPNTMRVKSGEFGYQLINQSLDKLELEFRRVYWQAREAGINPSYQYIRENVYIFKKKPINFFTIYDHFIDEELKLKSESSRKKHRSLYNHLETFSKKKKYRLEFDTVNIAFYHRLVNYLLYDQKMINTTVAKYTGILHWFLKWAASQGYNKNRDYENFKPPERKVTGVASGKVILSLQEVLSIYNADLPKHLDTIRDGFCLMAFTAMRFSDLKNLKHTDIYDDSINLVTVKTGDKLQIPLINYSRAILDKYKDWPIHAIPTLSNQKFNEGLKKIGKAVKLNDPVTLVSYRGATRIERTRPKHELLSCHCARRSFITIAIQLGIRTEVIQSITGHKTHKIMEEYYKIMNEDKKKEMQKFN